jgi:predicted nucleic acid-binding OB-fold protein
MIQYFHNMYANPDRFTLAVDVPQKFFLENLINLSSEKDIEILVGVSIVHPKDRYVKSIGRQLSNSRLQLMKFTLLQIDFGNEHAFLEFYSHKVSITIKLHKYGLKPHLINAIYEKVI